MKKKIILATLLCALAALTGCGEEPASQSSNNTSAENDWNDDEDWDEDWDDDEYVPSVDEIVGVWYEQDALDPRTLFVYDDYTFSLQYQGGGSLDGTVEITEEDHPDDTVTYWYTFYDQEGDFWEGFCADTPWPTELWSGQDGELHFINSSEFDTSGSVAPSSGGGITGAYFTGTWQSDRCTIEVTEVGSEYIVEVVWPTSADESDRWIYQCEFAEDTETLECYGYGTYVTEYADDNGNIGEMEIYDDGYATFTLSYGLLYWTDYEDNAGDGLDFENIGMG